MPHLNLGEVRVPVPAWVREYDRTWLRGDLLAGVTVTAYLIPQVMAYAEVAGVPSEAALWAVIGGLTVYVVVGSSRQLSVGPESTTSLMTATALGSLVAVGDDRVPLAAALALMVGLFCLAGWVLRLGALADLLSRPVLVGYLAGIAFTMAASQLGKLVGIAEDASSFLDEVRQVLSHLDQMHAPTAALGLVTLAVLLTIAHVLPRAPTALIGMLGATAAVWLLDLKDRGIATVGQIPAGLHVPGLPDVAGQDLTTLIGPAVGIAFVAYTDNILTGRAFASRHGQTVDAQRELLALGGANLGAGLAGGLPVSSSGSRTAIGDAVGQRTQLGGVVTVLCTVLALLTLRPLLAEFPVAGLAAVVVYAATRLVDVRELVRFGRFRISELVLALATTIAVLALGVLLGIVAAIALSVLDLLRRVARPHDAVLGIVPGVAGMHDVDDYPSARVVPGLMIYRYDSPLFFANAEDFRLRALASVDEAETPVRWFVLNAEAVSEVDITAADALEELRAELERRGVVMGIARMKEELREDLGVTPFLQHVPREMVFATLPTTVQAYQAWAEGQLKP
jgi:SulP family sulfate permease